MLGYVCLFQLWFGGEGFAQKKCSKTKSNDAEATVDTGEKNVILFKMNCRLILKIQNYETPRR